MIATGLVVAMYLVGPVKSGIRDASRMNGFDEEEGCAYSAERPGSDLWELIFSANESGRVKFKFAQFDCKKLRDKILTRPFAQIQISTDMLKTRAHLMTNDTVYHDIQ